MPPEYLVQRGTGRIRIWNEILAGRKDYEPIDPTIAKVRIEQTRKNIEKRKAAAVEGTQNEYIAKLSELCKALESLENEFIILEKAEKERVDIEKEDDRLAAEGTPKKSIPTEEDLNKERIESDPHVKRIRAMTTWNQLNDYMVMEFGAELDKRKTNIGKLIDEVVAARVERIEEV